MKGKKGSQAIKLGLIISVITVVFLGSLGAGLYFVWNKVAPLNPKIEKAQEKEAEEENAQDEIGPVFSLETFVVNLADEVGARYLRATMDLELNSEEMTAEIEKQLPQIRNAILTIIRSKTSKDINTIEGKIALRDEIM